MKRVFVGAGHSRDDAGAVSADGKLREADLTLRIRDLIGCEILGAVSTDGYRGENEPLRDSIAIAKTCEGPRIECHFNAAASSTAQGVEALSLPELKELSQALAQSVAIVTKSPLRGENGWKPQDSGQHSRLAFCLEAKGIILELAFISNPSEMARYLAGEAQIARNIAGVLKRYAS